MKQKAGRWVGDPLSTSECCGTVNPAAIINLDENASAIERDMRLQE
jgi:hypothetical protein